MSNECTADITSCSSAQGIAACAIVILHVAAAAAIHRRNVYSAMCYNTQIDLIQLDAD